MENQNKKHHSSKPSPSKKPDNIYARLSGITFEILSLNLIFIGGGYYLNDLVDPAFPWVWLICIFLSMAATIFYLLRKFDS